MLPALRSLAKSPGFTVTALITLALGIGVNTSMFSALNALLFHTPYPDDSRLVRIYRTAPQAQNWPHSVANFLDHREQNTVFERIAAFSWTSFILAEPGQPAENLRGLSITADFFPIIGVPPELGRGFTVDEDQPGKNAVIVLSHGTWLQRFGGDPSIIGRQLRIDAEPVTVIGIMPAHFDLPQLWGKVDAWRPIAFSAQARANRGNNFLNEIARLKPGVTLAQAQAQLNNVAAGLATAYPQNNAQNGLRVAPLAGSGWDGGQITWFVCSLAGFVLLIACANLANLQFARHAGRSREQAIRAALGASRWRLVRGVLAESLLLSLAGGALGLLVALWCNEAISQRFLIGGAAYVTLPLDVRTLLFAFIASILTGLAFGALPAWFSSRHDVNHALKQGARGTTAGRTQHRIRHSLIVIEVALALVLLAGAGFFVRGVNGLVQSDPDWRIDGLLTASIDLRGRNYASDAQRRAFYDRLREKIPALPGVEQAAFGSSLPTWGFSSSSTFVVEGRPEPAPGTAPLATVAGITPNYFTTLGLRLVQGRDFTSDDGPEKPAVTIINEAMARALWPGENPLGKRIGNQTPFFDRPREIVGVVSDAGATTFSAPPSKFQMYRPLAQQPGNALRLALRTPHPPAAIADELRRAVAEIDPDQVVYDIDTVRGGIDRGFASLRLAGHALAGFALLGLLLAAVGIYGVISGYVVQRTNEIGIRMALGAQVRDILQLVLAQGLRLAVIGTVLGLAGAFGVTRLLHAIAPRLPLAAPATTVGVTLLLLAVATLACWLPARWATKVDPIVALRAE